MLWTQGEEGAGGASGAIFALMMIALLWAPKNNFVVFYFLWVFIWIRVGTWDVLIQTFSLIYLCLNILTAWLVGFEMSSPVLHLIGAFVGFPVGLIFLLAKWVDCENWDLISVWQGNHESRQLQPHEYRNKSLLVVNPSVEEELKADPDELLDKLAQLINRGLAEAAYRTYQKCKKAGGVHLELDLPRHRKLIEGLQKFKLWKEAAICLKDYLHKNPPDDAQARLILAGILAKELLQPKKALEVLEPIDPATLPEEKRKLFSKIASNAKAQIANGVLEIRSD